MVSFSVLSPVSGSDKQADQTNVVTSTALIEDFVKNVGKDLVNVSGILIEGNEDPHTYEPVSSDLSALISADIFFLMGREGLEPWWNNWEQSILEDNPDLIVIEIMNASMVEKDELTGENNPHGWMSPFIAKEMVRNIYIELKEVISPSEIDQLNSNYASYQNVLDQLIIDIQGNRTILEGTKVVVNHPAFKYLYDLLGIKRLGVIEEQHDVPPSAKHIQEIKEIMKDEDITLIVHQTNLEDDEVNQIALDSGAEIVYGAPLIGMTGENGIKIDTYVQLIRYNIWALQNPKKPPETQNIPGMPMVTLILSVSLMSLIIINKLHKKGN
jgi:zinc transport system substrate-binding protein